MFFKTPALISPAKAYAKGYITNLHDSALQIGSDGIDLTLSSIFKVDINGTSVLSENKNTCRKRDRAAVVPAFDANSMLCYTLTEGVYDVTFNESVHLPKGVAADIRLRSSLVRDGHLGACGWYDSGFDAPAGFLLHVKGGRLVLESSVRLAQILFFTSDTHKLYNGQYNNQVGAHWFDKFRPKP